MADSLTMEIVSHNDDLEIAFASKDPFDISRFPQVCGRFVLALKANNDSLIGTYIEPEMRIEHIKFPKFR